MENNGDAAKKRGRYRHEPGARADSPGVEVKRAQTDPCAVQRRAAARANTLTVSHRPCFDRHNFSPDRKVLSNVDRSIDRVVPHGRVVRAVHDVYLDFHGSGQGRIAFVLGSRLQLVSLSLCTRGNISRSSVSGVFWADWRMEDGSWKVKTTRRSGPKRNPKSRPPTPGPERRVSLLLFDTNLALTEVTIVPTVTFSLM